MKPRWLSASLRFSCFVLIITIGFSAKAQDTPQAQDTNAVSRKGDTVFLKGGGIIQGVQVLRATSFVVELQTLADLPPLVLPKSQVTRIDYDEYDPGLASPPPVSEGVAEVIMGTKLSPEFDRKLFSELPEPGIKVENEDFLTVITELARQQDISLKVTDSVKQMPKENRLWTVKIGTKTSFMTLLRENLSASFPMLRIEINYESITLAMRSENRS